MARYILYFTGADHAPARDLKQIEHDPTTDILATGDDMVLVEADNHRSIERFLAKTSGWRVSTGTQVAFPVETGVTRAERRSAPAVSRL
jgi:hypothetical protein